MKATEINENTIQKANCDWVTAQIKEIKALLSYNNDEMIQLNKQRALSGIETAINSLNELRLYIESK